MISIETQGTQGTAAAIWNRFEREAPESDTARRERFEQLAFEHIDSLFSTALRMTRNRADAEDIVQDTYLRAYRFFDRFEPGTRFKSWIFTILKRVAINEFKKNGAKRKQVDYETIEPTLPAAESNSISHDPAALAGTDVGRAVARLPAGYRMPVILAFVEGFSYKEISKIMGCPIGTVMSRIHRARNKLRADLLDSAEA